MADINRMMRGSIAIYCEAPKAVADDISYMLRTGAEEIITLRARVARLEEALRNAVRAIQSEIINNPNGVLTSDAMLAEMDARRALEEK